jgi:uncharacterized membrane protein
MDKTEVKFGEWIERGFDLYKQNIGTLILAGLIAVVLGSVTVGILAGPMLAGMLLITLGLFDNAQPKPEFTTVFRGFDFFLNSLLFILVWGVALFILSFILGLIPCIGQIVSVFAVLAAQALLIFGLFLIVDQHMDFWPASRASFDMIKTNFWPFLGFSIVASIIGSIGAIAFGIGLAVTLPIQACILTVAYCDVFGRAEKATPVEESPSDEVG